MNGKINGFFHNPTTIKIIVGTIFAIGVWVGTIQADVQNKAEKIDVASQQAALTEALKSINKNLDDIKDSVQKIDERQRKISEDVTKLKAKQE